MKEALSRRQLQLLMHVSDILNSSLDIDSVIDSIMNESISVIDAADAGVLFLYDFKQKCLVATSTYGYQTYRLIQVKLKPGQALAGVTFLAKKCLMFSNQSNVKETYSSLTEKTIELFTQSVPTYPYSAICAPIISNNQCIGVINLGSFRPESRFTLDDVNLLTAISHQAAVALEKAELYQEKKEIINKLEYMNDEIKKQNEIFSRSISLHNSLAALVLHGQSLSSILNYIFETMGHHCFLFDDINELLLFTNDPHIQNEFLENLKQQVSPYTNMDEISKKVIEVEIQGNNYIAVILPIGSKPGLLGALVVLSNEKIDEMDISALEHASTVISLELMKERAVVEAQQRIRGEFIDVLFSGKVDESLIQKAKYLRLNPKDNYIIVMVNMKEIESEKHKRYVIESANKVFNESKDHGVIVRKNSQIVILHSFNSRYSQSYINSHIKELADRYLTELSKKKWGRFVSIGIGRLKEGIEKAYKSAQEAIKCLQFIQGHRVSKQVMSYSDLGVQRLLLQNTEEELMDFIDEMLGPLIEYDRKRKGNLLQTLLTYIENNHKGTETAKMLHMHINTLNYRLKRIEEILTIDLSDAEQFLNLQLAVNMYQYLKVREKD